MAPAYYLDTSVLLRVLLRLPGAWSGWSKLKYAGASELLELECIRTLERYRLAGKLDDDGLAVARSNFERVYATLHVQPIDRTILSRAKESFPTPVGSLDAIHLATAMAFSRTANARVSFLTHDKELGKAAAALGLTVVGVE